MEGTALTDNIIRNIVAEVLRECKNRKIRASIDFIQYYINLLRLDPNRKLTHEHLHQRERIQNLIKYIVGRLGSKDDPKILTLRLQHEYRAYIKNLDNMVHENRRRLNDKLYPLLLNIVEQHNKIFEEELYRKICFYITLASGLGNPNDKAVFKEALQVLRSVLTPAEIAIFPTVQNFIKQEMIGSLIDIVTGIRLYNRSCKKGGAGIADLPQLMKRAIDVIKIELDECVIEARRRARIITRSVEKHMRIIKRSHVDWDIILKFNSPEERLKWEFNRDLAAAHRQLSKTTLILSESINELDRHHIYLNEQFKETIDTLDRTVVPKLHQDVTLVFPHFVRLSKIWKEYQDEGMRLQQIYNIFLMQSKQIFTLDYDLRLEHEESYLDDWILKEDEELITEVEHESIKVVEDTQHIRKKHLMFQGYCCWALTKTEGALIPANIHLGVVEYKGKLYGFSTRMAANCFTRNPHQYIMQTIELARKRVHLIKFLNLEHILKENIDVEIITEKEEVKTAVQYEEIQTDTHFEDSYIEYRYKWNIWDYKRPLLCYLDIMRKQTKACETHNTLRTQASHTQTYEHINVECQTKTDNYGCTDKPAKFVYGLRGTRSNDQYEMDLKNVLRFSSIIKKKE